MKKLFNKKIEEDEIEKVDAEVVETEETAEDIQPKKSHKRLLIGAGIGAAVLTVAGLMLHKKKDTDFDTDWYGEEESEDDEDAETSDESDELSDEPTSKE